MAAPVGSLVLEMAADVAKLRGDMANVERTVDRTMQRVQRSGRRLDSITGTIRGLGTALAAAFSVQSGIAIVRRAENFRLLGVQVSQATDSTEEFERTFKELRDTSNATGASLQSTVQFFQRLALFKDEIGVTNKVLIKVVANVQKLAAIQGIGGAQLSAGILQLSQALASGKLAGDELRSILENLPPVAKAIAAGLGVSTSELRKMGKEGKLNRDQLVDILANVEGLDEKFANIPPTIGRATNVLTNSFDELLEKILNTSGALGGMAGLIQRMAGGVQAITENIGPETTTIFDLLQSKISEVTQELNDAVAARQRLIKDQSGGSGAIAAAIALANRIAGETDVKLKREVLELQEQLNSLVLEYGRLTAIAAADKKALADEENKSVRATKLSEEAQKALAKEAEKVRGIINAQNKDFEEFLEGPVADAEALLEPLRGIADRIKGIRRVAAAGLLSDKDALKAELLLLKEISKELDQTSKNATASVSKVKDSTKTLLEEISSAVDDAARTMTDAFIDFATGAKGSFKDMVNSMLTDIARLIFRKSIAEPLATGISGFIGGLFSPKALGGPVSGGTPYLVGERGPELFVPSGSGTIIPNGEVGGGNLSVNFSITANDTRGFDQLLQERKGQIVGMINSAMEKQGRRGLAR